MTLIIGIKYFEGIVLIGDTKIVEGVGKFRYDKKIEKPLRNEKLAIASAGLTALAKEFNRKIFDLTNQRFGEYDSLNRRDLAGTGLTVEQIVNRKILRGLTYNYNENKFLDDCTYLTKELCDRVRNQISNPLNTIVAMNGSTPLLYQIDSNGLNMEYSYVAIGSGSVFIMELLKSNFKENMTLLESIKLGTFLIKYVEQLNLDGGVGLENENSLPQVFVLNKDQCDDYSIETSLRKEILDEINDRLQQIETATTLTKKED